MKNRSELKQEVKNTFRGHWGKAILISLIPIIIAIILGLSYGMAIRDNFYGNQPKGHPINLVFSIFIELITTGITFTFIDWLKNDNLKIKPLKDAFAVFNSKDFLTVLGIIVLRLIYTFLWTLLLVVPGIIKAYSYSQALNMYKKAKDEGKTGDYSINDYITQSRELMNGHKFEYFVLLLSFIGWNILAIITIGIGYLWLDPYMRATSAAFFNNLIDNNLKLK